MRAITASILTLVLALSAAAQQGHKFELDTATPEGQLLQKAGQAATDAEKIAAYDDFLALKRKFKANAG